MKTERSEYQVHKAIKTRGPAVQTQKQVEQMRAQLHAVRWKRRLAKVRRWLGLQ